MTTIMQPSEERVKLKQDLHVKRTPECALFKEGEEGILTGKVGYCTILWNIEPAVEVRIAGLIVFIPASLLEVINVSAKKGAPNE